MLTTFERSLANKATAPNKYHISRELLVHLNEQGESSLGVRRELLKRVVEFEDYSICWEGDRAIARGLVAQIRDLVNKKDSFTRMRNEKDEEKRKRIEVADAEVKAVIQNKHEREQVYKDLCALFGVEDAQSRGKALESVLNRLFNCHGILIREAFTIKGNCSEGVIEQIDGVIELDGTLYLVEMKWWNSALGPGDVAQHIVRVFSRGGNVRGVFISYSKFTDAAIASCREAIVLGRIVVLTFIEDIVRLLSQDGDLKNWLKSKVDSAVLEKNPLVR